MKSDFVNFLPVEDKDEWIDSELELEDCCDEGIEKLDDCSELLDSL